MSNFKCNKCNKEVTISKFNISVKNGELVYSINNSVICCDEKKCKKHPLIALDANPGEDITAPFIMKVAGMDANQRTEYFNKRARDNFKKHGRDEKMDKLKQYGAKEQ